MSNGATCVDKIVLNTGGSSSVWEDNAGDTCSDYKRDFYCAFDSTTGRGGKGWNWKNGDTFAQYRNLSPSNMMDASDACCMCGGGTSVEPVHTTQGASLVTSGSTNQPTAELPTYTELLAENTMLRSQLQAATEKTCAMCTTLKKNACVSNVACRWKTKKAKCVRN
jgi:hypothetical protein